MYQVVAADPRPIRVLSLPFGLRDGLSSRGNYSSSSQFYQTFHEKRLVGGYISRLPNRSIERYRRNPTLRVLLRLSEGTPVEPELYERALSEADRNLRRLDIGYVVIDPSRCVSRARRVRATGVPDDAGLEEGGLELYSHADGAASSGEVGLQALSPEPVPPFIPLHSSHPPVHTSLQIDNG